MSNPLDTAQEYLKQGKRNEAAFLINAYLKKHPEDVEAWWLLCQTTNNQRRVKVWLNRIIELDPTHEAAHARLLEINAPHLDLDELRPLYHQLARRYHPDGAMTPDAKIYRTHIMAQINAAFRAGDRDTLANLAAQEIISPDYRYNPQPHLTSQQQPAWRIIGAMALMGVVLLCGVIFAVLSLRDNGDALTSIPPTAVMEIVRATNTDLPPTILATRYSTLPPTWTPVVTATPTPIRRIPNTIQPTQTPTSIRNTPTNTSSPTMIPTQSSTPTPQPNDAFFQAAVLGRGTINAIDLDGRNRLLVGSQRGGWIYEVTTGNLIRTIEDIPRNITAVAWSPTGDRVALGADDGTIRIWTDEGSLLHVFSGQNGEIISLAWSPDETRLLAGDNHSGVWVWDTEQGLFIRDIGGLARWNYAQDWSPDGSRILMGGDGGSLTLWDVREDVLLNTWNLADYSIYDVAYSPDGIHFATAGNEGRIRIWAGDEEVATFQTDLATNGGDTWVLSVAWSSDGRYLLTGNSANNIQLWRILEDDGSITPRALYSLNHEDHSAQALVMWSSDDTQIISAGWDGFIRVRNSLDGTLVHEIVGHTSAIESLVWSPDSSTLAGSTYGGGLYIWDATDPTIPLTLVRNIQKDEPRTLSWSPDGQEVVIWSRNRNVQLWYPPTFDRLLNRSVAFAPVLEVGWLTNGTRLVLKQRVGSIEVMNSEILQPITNLSCGATRLGEAAFSPNSTRVAVTQIGEHSVFICDTSNGQLVQLLNGHSDWVLDLAWSPDGMWLATASVNREVIIWEVATGRQRFFWNSFNTPMQDMAWSADGNFIALATTDQQPGRIEIRDVNNGEIVQTLEEHFSIVESLAWSPNNHWLASGSADGVIMLWQQSDN